MIDPRILRRLEEHGVAGCLIGAVAGLRSGARALWSRLAAELHVGTI